MKVEEAIASRRGLVDERTKAAGEIEALASEIEKRLDLRAIVPMAFVPEERP